MVKVFGIVAAIILFASLAFGQSVENNRVVFRETFDDEFSVRRNGGTPTDVTFSNGVGVFDGVSTNIIYNKPIKGTYSVRLRFKSINVTDGYLLDFRMSGAGQGYMYFLSPGIVEGAGGGTAYVDGVHKTPYEAFAVSNSTKEIVITEMIINTWTDFHIGEALNGLGHGTFELDLFEIYNYTLTAEEVENLYSNRRHRDIGQANEILNVSAQSGSIIDRQGNTLTNTATTVVKDGDARVMLFDGSSSKVDCGEPHDLTGDITAVTWFKPYSYINYNRIVGNGKFVVMAHSSQLYGQSDGSTSHIISLDVLNKWTMLVCVRKSSGLMSFYINGVLSGAADQDSGTPTAGTNIIIGSPGGENIWDGLISDVRIHSGILSAAEISQLYTNEKHKYAQ